MHKLVLLRHCHTDECQVHASTAPAAEGTIRGVVEIRRSQAATETRAAAAAMEPEDAAVVKTGVTYMSRAGSW